MEGMAPLEEVTAQEALLVVVLVVMDHQEVLGVEDTVVAEEALLVVTDPREAMGTGLVVVVMGLVDLMGAIMDLQAAQDVDTGDVEVHMGVVMGELDPVVVVTAPQGGPDVEDGDAVVEAHLVVAMEDHLAEATGPLEARDVEDTDVGAVVRLGVAIGDLTKDLLLAMVMVG